MNNLRYINLYIEDGINHWEKKSRMEGSRGFMENSERARIPVYNVVIPIILSKNINGFSPDSHNQPKYTVFRLKENKYKVTWE